MIFKLYTYQNYHFLHFIGFYVTFVNSEFSNYSVMQRMHYSFANIFSKFHIAKKQLETQITGAMSVRVYFAFKYCTRRTMNHSTSV